MEYLEYDESGILDSIGEILLENFSNASLKYLESMLVRKPSNEEKDVLMELLKEKIDTLMEDWERTSVVWDLGNDIEYDIDQMVNDIKDDLEFMDELDQVEQEEDNETNTFGFKKKVEPEINIVEESEFDWNDVE